MMSRSFLCTLVFLVAAPVHAQLTKEDVDRINRLWQQAQAEQRKAELDRIVKELENPTDPSTPFIGMIHLSTLKLPPEQGIPITERLLASRHQELQQGAIQMLGRYGKKAKQAGPKVFELFNDKLKSSFVTEAAALTLGQIGYDRPEVIDAFIARLEDPHRLTGITQEVTKGLALFGPKAEKAVPVLRRLLEDRNPHVAKLANQAIASIRAAPAPVE